MRKFILKLRKRAQLERDLDEELKFHREMSNRDFGNSTRIREEARGALDFSIYREPDPRLPSRLPRFGKKSEL